MVLKKHCNERTVSLELICLKAAGGLTIVFRFVKVGDAVCRLSVWPAEARTDVYLVSCQKGGKKVGIKARGKEEGGQMRAGDKGASLFELVFVIIIVVAAIAIMTIDMASTEFLLVQSK